MNIKKLLVIILIAAAGWYAFYGQQRVFMADEKAEAYLKHIERVKNDKLLQLLESYKGQAYLIHIYSADCILCRIYFNDVVNVARKNKNLPVLAISVDKYPRLLASFLINKDLPFTPYLFEGNTEALVSILKSQGISYIDTPYTAIVEPGPKVKEFNVGTDFRSRINNYLMVNGGR